MAARRLRQRPRGLADSAGGFTIRGSVIVLARNCTRGRYCVRGDARSDHDSGRYRVRGAHRIQHHRVHDHLSVLHGRVYHLTQSHGRR